MKSVTKPVRDGAAEGRTGDWGEVVTRYPYENVGMDHLLSMEKEKTNEKTANVTVLLSFERTEKSLKRNSSLKTG